jgi:hypothetical protein
MMERAASFRALREGHERDALRLLCSDLISPDTRVHLAGMLNERAFENDLNRAVYEEIVDVGAVGARRLRELLPGRVTLRGFPDFELKEFLGRSDTSDDIDRLFDSLLQLVDVPPRENRKALGQSA